jgi:flagellar basal-body rod modification protein FlgD
MITNGVSTTEVRPGSQAAIDAGQLGDDLNRFLTLLVTQLQNQDPLDPLDTNEFTSQLVQFASVEQQIYQNKNLEQLLAIEKSLQTSSMVDYLGTVAEVRSKDLSLEQGQALASYSLGAPVAATTIAVKNAQGNVVYMASGETSAGTHAFTWRGTDDAGIRVPDGRYTLDISAKRQDGTAAEAAITTFGTVTAASADGGDVTLYLGDIAIPMSDVLSIKSPPEAAVSGE